jgi:hypothetical protein
LRYPNRCGCYGYTIESPNFSFTKAIRVSRSGRKRGRLWLMLQGEREELKEGGVERERFNRRLYIYLKMTIICRYIFLRF